jgi:hypothetical protein
MKRCVILSGHDWPRCVAYGMPASSCQDFCSDTATIIIASLDTDASALGFRLRFTEYAHHIVLEDCVATIDAAMDRRDRLTTQIEIRLSGPSRKRSARPQRGKRLQQFLKRRSTTPLSLYINRSVLRGNDVYSTEFRISDVALSIFREASIDPRRVNKVIDKQLAYGRGALLRPKQFHCSKVRRTTGVPLQWIGRAHRSLLIGIENREPFWTYEEEDSRSAWLNVCGLIPRSLEAGLIGKPLEEVIELPLLSGTRIQGFRFYSHTTDVRLDMPWHKISKSGAIQS